MAYNQTVNFTPYDEQMAELQRRQRIADLMQQQAIAPLETPQSGGRMIAKVSPVAGLAKMLQAYMAGKEQRDIGQQQKELGRQDVQNAMSLMDRLQAGKPSEMSPDQALAASLSTQPTARAPNQPFSNVEQRQFLIGQGLLGGPRTQALAAALMPKPTSISDVVSKPNIENATPESVAEFQRDFAAKGIPNYSILKFRNQYTDTTAEGRENRAQAQKHWEGLSADQKANIQIALGNSDISRARLLHETGVNVPPVSNVSATATSAPAIQTPIGGQRPVVNRQSIAPQGTIIGQKSEVKEIPQINNPAIAPVQRQKLTLEMPQAKQAAIGTLNKLDLIEKYLDDLENHPGLDRITGKYAQDEWTDVTPEARNARSIYNTLKNATSVQAISQARDESKTGGAYGSMTEKEWPRLETTFGAIQNSQDAKDLRVAIRNAKKQVQAAKANAENSWNQIYGKGTLNWSPIEYEKQSYRTKSSIEEEADRIIQGSAN